MHTRRSFLRYSATALAALPFLPLGRLAFADTSLPPLKETDPQAKALKYCANANKPSASCPARKDPKKKNEFCHNCQLYKKKSGENATEMGSCMLMTKNTVSGQGWCMSWVKMPGA